MKTLINRFVREEDGQDIIEYSLLGAFISVVAWLTLQNIGQDVADHVLRRSSRPPTTRRLVVLNAKSELPRGSSLFSVVLKLRTRRSTFS